MGKNIMLAEIMLDYFIDVNKIVSMAQNSGDWYITTVDGAQHKCAPCVAQKIIEEFKNGNF